MTHQRECSEAVRTPQTERSDGLVCSVSGQGGLALEGRARSAMAE